MRALHRRLILALCALFALVVRLAGAEPATGRDKKIREELLETILNRQDDRFREKFAIELPDAASNLPKNYDLLFYGHHVGMALLRIEVKVRGDKATMETATVSGIRRGNVPTDDIDRLARQLAYARLAKTERLPDAPTGGRRTAASHAPYRSYVIASRDRGNDFYLFTPPNQLLADSIDEGTRGLAGLIETEGEDALWTISKEHLHDVAPDAEWRSEIVRRLKAIRSPTTSDPEPVMRKDLAAVESLIYGELAVDWRIADAMDDLKRLELATLSELLAIGAASDPRPLLRAALHKENSRVFYYAIDFILKAERTPHLDVLVESIPATEPEHAATVIRRLGSAELSEAQFRVIETYYANSDDKDARIAAGILLLHRERGDRYYDDLRDLFLRKRPSPSHSDPEERGLHELFNYSILTGKRRDESAELARELLDRIPADAESDTVGLGSLIAAVGELGNRDDLPRLRRYFREECSTLASTVINAIAHIEPDEGLSMMRRQIQRYNAREGGGYYGNYVGTYLDVIVWQHDTSSTQALAAALAKYRRQSPDETSWVESSERALQYLRAESLADRVSAVKRYVDRAPLSEKWSKSIANQLIAEGANSKDVAFMIEPPEVQSSH